MVHVLIDPDSTLQDLFIMTRLGEKIDIFAQESCQWLFGGSISFKMIHSLILALALVLISCTKKAKKTNTVFPSLPRAHPS